MAIFRHYRNIPDSARGTVVAIGNFDGIHRGHQAVIAMAADQAKALGCPLSVMTFDPHPRRFFRPDSPPFKLSTLRTQVRLIESLGVNHFFVLPFTEDLSRLSAQDFVADVLVAGLAVRHVVVGANFHFGHKQQGNLALLQELGGRFGFGVTGVELVKSPLGEHYSSTAVREHLQAGDMTRAALLLGRYFELEGRVEKGAQLGRTLDFPTANIALGDMMLPAFGVYAVRAGIEGEGGTVWHNGVANLGVRPMVDGKTPLLEVHIFDFDGDLYNRHMRVALIEYLRPEMTFKDLAAMREQMLEDSRRARVILSWETWDSEWPAGGALADGRQNLPESSNESHGNKDA
jgi:riboflavin kinase/FMN adenylyltransferase